MAKPNYEAINKAMAERRARNAHAIEQVTKGASDFDERLDQASRMSDLLDALLALQPPDLELQGGLAAARWGDDHPDKRRVLANLAAIKAAIA